jgi:cell division protein FtsB
MSGPAQRAAERQAARRTASTRPSSRSTSARTGSTSSTASAQARANATTATRTGATGRAAAAVRRRPTLTGRAVVLAGVLTLIVFTLAVPTRELLHQRADINALRAANDATPGRVDALTIREQRLADPAYVTSLIRERLHYVLPGEVGYVVLDPSEAPAPTRTKPTTVAPAWYAALWSSVQTTDKAGTTPAAPVIPVRPNAPR